MRLNPRLFALPLALLAVFLVYGRSLKGGYVFDDHYFVEKNAAIRELSNAPRFFYDPSTQSSVENLNADVYRPLATLSFAADYAVAGAAPAYSRAVNLALHAAAAALLYPFSMLVTYSDIVELRLEALAFYLPFSAAVCLLYAGLAAALRARGQAAAAWGLLWVPLCLLPVLNIVPITVYMAERFLYLPAAGLGLALAAGAAALRGHKREWAVFAAFGALLLLFAANIQGRLQVWRSDVSLWSYDARMNPRNFVTRMRLADALLAAGDRQKAYACYQEARELARSRGQLAVALNEIGSMHAAAAELEKAEGLFKAAASYRPDSHLVFYNLGKVRFLRGDQRGARLNLERSLELKKNYAPALELLSHLKGK